MNNRKKSVTRKLLHSAAVLSVLALITISTLGISYQSSLSDEVAKQKKSITQLSETNVKLGKTINAKKKKNKEISEILILREEKLSSTEGWVQ